MTSRRLRAAGLVVLVLVMPSVAACSGSSAPSLPKAAAAASAIPAGDPRPTAGRLSTAVVQKTSGGVNASYVDVSSAEARSYRAGLLRSGWTRLGGTVSGQDGIDSYTKGRQSIGVGYDAAKKLLTVAYYPL